MVNSYIPEEIMIEIFSRVPSKSVGKFRCLSKSWSFSLSTSRFINLHLACKPQQENIILTKNSNICTIPAPIGNNVVSKKIELHESTGTTSKMVGSCNGLVLVVLDQKLLCLVNPLTNNKVVIPDSNGFWNYRSYGFGYDTCSDDYKIVTLSTCFGSSCVTSTVDVYSVKGGIWRTVGAFPYGEGSFPHGDCSGGTGPFINGAIHCVAYDHHCRSIIVAFDLATEVFYEIPCPTVAKGSHMTRQLGVFGGCLCLIDNPYFGMTNSSSSSNIWMMTEYGIEKSWSKFCVESRGKWRIRIPVCFIGLDEEEIVLLTDDEIVVVYNLKTKTTREIAVDGVLAYFNGGGIFVDSLVSPSQIAEESLHQQDVVSKEKMKFRIKN